MSIQEEIEKLKRDREALILAHYYVRDEVQEIADLIGDSYYLSRKAMESPKKTLVYCGVHFMGESAKILSPEKTVLMPDLEAGCPMAHMVTPGQIQVVRRKNPDAAVVCYINSTAETKACSDVCVTSSNALKIVRALPNHTVYFIPDYNLGHYIAQQVPEKRFLLHDGCCPVHKAIGLETLEEARRLHPGAKILAHPECPPALLEKADYIGSTAGILSCAEKSGGQEFLVGTEPGVLRELRKRCPDKAFYPLGGCLACTDMKRITLEKIHHVLSAMENALELDEAMRMKALRPLQRMHELAEA